MRPPVAHLPGIDLCRRLMLPLLLVSSGPLFAEPVPAGDGDTLRITWSDLRPAIEAHPRLEAARAATRLAAGARREAGALPNPGLEAHSLSVDPRNGADPTREEDFAVGIPLDWLWTRPGRLKAARAGEQMARAESGLMGRELLLEAGEAFWSLVREQALVESMDELDRQMQTLQQAVATRVRVGEARPVEAARVEVEVLQTGLEAAAARRSLALDRDLLAQWLLPDKGRLLVAEADLLRLPALPDAADRDGALRGHVRLDAARSRIEAERGALNVERMGVLPRLELQGSLERAEDRLARGAGLALELPLFNWKQGRIEQARARLQAAEAGLAAESRRLESDLSSAVAAFETSREQARVYQEQVLPRAEEAARVLESTWRAGEASLFELIDARRTLAAIRRQSILVFCQAQLDGLRLQTLLEKEMN